MCNLLEKNKKSSSFNNFSLYVKHFEVSYNNTTHVSAG